MYSGDISPADTFKALSEQEGAVLVDVRTPAEWSYVGIPAIDGLVRIPWPPTPDAPNFVENFSGFGIPKDAHIYLICRSGIRSASAAHELNAAGYKNCYNVAEGFEGDRDGLGHRGTIGGWKVAGLPWIQS